jgi:hypothetical protein
MDVAHLTFNFLYVGRLALLEGVPFYFHKACFISDTAQLILTELDVGGTNQESFLCRYHSTMILHALVSPGG